MTTIQEFDFSVDLLRAILWQYNDAKNLQSILQQKQDWYNKNQSEFWAKWIIDVFDLRTANEFGLSVWAVILDLPIIVQVGPASVSKPTFGFASTHKNFNHGNFSRRQAGTQTLESEQARIALRLRFFQLISRGTIPETNRFLNAMFNKFGPVYVRDNHDMTITFVFGFQPSSALQFVLQKYDILPRPAGVGANISVELVEPWGFDPYHENFDHQNFGV